MHPHDAFAERGRSAEEAYFRTKDSELVDKLKSVFEARKTKEELRAVTGITNDEALDKLLRVNLRGELLTVFKLWPLVEIAWADGTVDKKEIDAVIKAAVDSGVAKTGEAIKRLEEWLLRGPTPDGRTAWYAYAGELRKTLTPAELTTFRNDIIGFAKKVAAASGGFLGVVFEISPKEQAVIDKVTKALSPA